MKRKNRQMKNLKNIIGGMMIGMILGYSFPSMGQTPVAQSTIKYDSGSGTWNAPTGAYQITKIQAWGGGGGGGNAKPTSATNSVGTSGGGGAYAEHATAIKMNSGSLRSFSYQVGAGGSAGNAGGTSSFGSYVSANGGNGGSTLTAGATSSNSGSGASGGTATAGTTKTNGGTAETSYLYASKTYVSNIDPSAKSGKGGNAPNGGTGGAGVQSKRKTMSGTSYNGNAGNAPGGGGSGGAGDCYNLNNTYSGGAGANGAVWITYNTLTLNVTFSNNYTGGGNFSTTTIPYYNTYSSIKPSSDPTRTNYKFDGWFFDAACTNAVNWSENCVRESNFTIYAKWTPDPKITLNAISTSGNNLCNGDGITLSVTAASSAGTVTYSWTGAGLNSTTSSSVTANPTVNTTYTVVATATVETATATATKSINIIVDNNAPTLTGSFPSNISNRTCCYNDALAADGMATNNAIKDLYTDDYHTVTVNSTDDTIKNNKAWKITRTFTITDACGNTVTPAPAMSISGSDQIVPELTGSWPSDMTNIDTCYDKANLISKLASDETIKALFSDCSNVIVSHNDTEVKTSCCDWKITRTFTIKDSCGNTVTPAPTMSISGGDNSAPELTGSWPSDISNLDTCYDKAKSISKLTSDETIKAIFSDCSNVIVSHNDTEEKTSYCDWKITRTFTIKDSCGNTVSPAPTMSISGGDNSAPELTGSWPSDITNLDTCYDKAKSISKLVTDETIKALYSDFSSVVVSHNDTEDKTDNCDWKITRTFTITDSCGNTVSPAPTMSISGGDNSVPTLTGVWPSNIENQINGIATADITGLPTNEAIKALFSDITAITVSSTLDTTGNDNGWIITKTFSIEDGCGNTVSPAPTVSVSGKNLPPRFVGGPWTDTLAQQSTCVSNADLTVFSSYDNVKTLFTDEDEIVVTSKNDTTGNASNWTIKITFTIQDALGATADTTLCQVISGIDATAPELTGSWPTNITGVNKSLNDVDFSTVFPSNDDIKALFSDCQTIIVTNADDTLSTDNCDWKVERTYTIYAGTDTVKPLPTLTAQGADADVPTLKTAGTWPTNITGQQNCLANADITGLKSNDDIKALYKDESSFTVTSTTDTVGNDQAWTITRTYTIKDACDNTIDPAPTMSVMGGDTIRPTYTRPNDTTLYADVQCQYDTTIANVGDVTDEYDNCSDNIEATYTDEDITPSDACQGMKVFKRTWRLVDIPGNVSKSDSIQTITILDTIRPTYTRPVDTTIYKDNNCNYDITPAVTGMISNVWDNCSTTLDTSYTDVDITPSDACQGLTIIQRTWKLTDNCGNMALSDSVQIITIEDSIRPTYTRPIDVTLFKDKHNGFNADPSVTGMISNVWDNCSTTLDTTYTDVDASAEFKGCEGHTVIKRYWRLTDNCGNISLSDSLQIIVIRDTISPTFTAPKDTMLIVANVATADYSIAVTGDVTDEADNCTSVLEAQYSDLDITPDDACQGMKVIKRTWSLVDSCENEAAHQDQIITISENSAPTFNVPADIVICRNALRMIDADSSITGVPTHVGGNNLSKTITFEDIDTTGTDNEYRVITREWTVTDDCGSYAKAEQLITIAPAINDDNFRFNYYNDTTIILNYGACDTILNFDTITYTCDIANANITLSAKVISLQAPLEGQAIYGTLAKMNAPVTNIFSAGAYDFVWTATDSCGFTMEYKFRINIEYPACGTKNDPYLIADIDGNEYNTIRVGCECWMAENLKAQHYADNAEIPVALTYVSRINANEPQNLENFGRLYDWKSATRNVADTATGNVQGACPEGWRLPTATDFNNLTQHVTFIEDLKSKDYWMDKSGTDVIGMNIRPAGIYNTANEQFENLFGKTCMHVFGATQSTPQATFVTLSCGCPGVIYNTGDKENAYSIRCIRVK